MLSFGRYVMLGDLELPKAALAKFAQQFVFGAQIGWSNAPLERFVLPGGTELAARLHLARTLCRRAERTIVALAVAEPVNPRAIVYVNRVSDLLFALARRANREAGVEDVPWFPAG